MRTRRSFRSAVLGLVVAAGLGPCVAAPADDIPPMARKAKGFDLALLAPVEGITLRQIGEASYYFGFVPSLTRDEVLKNVGIDKTHFDEAEKVFTQRMVADKTFTINALFGAYSDEAAIGRFAAYGRDVAHSVLDGSAPLREPEPMAEDKFRMIQAYYARKAATAGTSTADLDKVLAPFDLTYNDFQLLSGWFGRRLALQAEAQTGGAPPGRDDRLGTDEAANAAPPAPQRPELGGLWHLTWTLLKRGETGMEMVSESRDICLKRGMTAATLPLMPKRGTAKCALHNIDFYDNDIAVGAQCDEGAYGSGWFPNLQPAEPGKTDAGARYKGEMQFSMQNESLGDLAPHASTPVTARRIGDCK